MKKRRAKSMLLSILVPLSFTTVDYANLGERMDNLALDLGEHNLNGTILKKYQCPIKRTLKTRHIKNTIPFNKKQKFDSSKVNLEYKNNSGLSDISSTFPKSRSLDLVIWSSLEVILQPLQVILQPLQVILQPLQAIYNWMYSFGSSSYNFITQQIPLGWNKFIWQPLKTIGNWMYSFCSSSYNFITQQIPLGWNKFIRPSLKAIGNWMYSFGSSAEKEQKIYEKKQKTFNMLKYNLVEKIHNLKEKAKKLEYALKRIKSLNIGNSNENALRNEYRIAKSVHQEIKRGLSELNGYRDTVTLSGHGYAYEVRYVKNVMVIQSFDRKEFLVQKIEKGVQDELKQVTKYMKKYESDIDGEKKITKQKLKAKAAKPEHQQYIEPENISNTYIKPENISNTYIKPENISNTYIKPENISNTYIKPENISNILSQNISGNINTGGDLLLMTNHALANHHLIIACATAALAAAGIKYISGYNNSRAAKHRRIVKRTLSKEINKADLIKFIINSETTAQ